MDSEKNEGAVGSGESKKGVRGPSAPGMESKGGSMIVLLNHGWRSISSIDSRLTGSS